MYIMVIKHSQLGFRLYRSHTNMTKNDRVFVCWKWLLEIKGLWCQGTIKATLDMIGIAQQTSKASDIMSETTHISVTWSISGITLRDESGSLENIVNLYLRVRFFSHARGYISKFKIEGERQSRSLKKDLKRSEND